MLDERVSMTTNGDADDVTHEDGKKRDMNPWLRDKLEGAGVLSIIEPFWSSLYKQVWFLASFYSYFSTFCSLEGTIIEI